MSYKRKIKIWYRKLPVLSRGSFWRQYQRLAGRGKKSLIIRYRKLGLL